MVELHDPGARVVRDDEPGAAVGEGCDVGLVREAGRGRVEPAADGDVRRGGLGEAVVEIEPLGVPPLRGRDGLRGDDAGVHGTARPGHRADPGVDRLGDPVRLGGGPGLLRGRADALDAQFRREAGGAAEGVRHRDDPEVAGFRLGGRGEQADDRGRERGGATEGADDGVGEARRRLLLHHLREADRDGVPHLDARAAEEHDVPGVGGGGGERVVPGRVVVLVRRRGRVDETGRGVQGVVVRAGEPGGPGADVHRPVAQQDGDPAVRGVREGAPGERLDGVRDPVPGAQLGPAVDRRVVPLRDDGDRGCERAEQGTQPVHDGPLGGQRGAGDEGALQPRPRGVDAAEPGAVADVARGPFERGDPAGQDGRQGRRPGRAEAHGGEHAGAGGEERARGVPPAERDLDLGVRAAEDRVDVLPAHPVDRHGERGRAPRALEDDLDLRVVPGAVDADRGFAAGRGRRGPEVQPPAGVEADVRRARHRDPPPGRTARRRAVR